MLVLVDLKMVAIGLSSLSMVFAVVSMIFVCLAGCSYRRYLKGSNHERD